MFSDRSMYMQMKTKSFRESFSKNIFYRFLDSAKTNWLRFTILLSKKVIDSLEPLTSDDRINAFIVDDSLFERTSCKKTELGAKVFDHCDRRYKKGFRLLSLLWTDSNTAVPVNSCPLSSTQDKNVLGPETSFDGRLLAGQRRKLSRMKGTKAMVELISKALSAGIKAEYVLFDTWEVLVTDTNYFISILSVKNRLFWQHFSRPHFFILVLRILYQRGESQEGM